jgi:diphosphomevalonate decarboxylase
MRLARIKDKIILAKKLLAKKDFPNFGELIESEALELHAIMLTATPSLIYWLPGTVSVMRLVKKLRNEGLPVYFTVNTGQDVHLIVEQKNTKTLVNNLKGRSEIKNIIINFPAVGARLLNGRNS